MHEQLNIENQERRSGFQIMKRLIFLVKPLLGGILQPTTSAFLHNASTLTIGLKSMQNLLVEEKK